MAQAQEVTGKVIDSTGAPIPGATVNVKGVRRGASAGPDGSFHIAMPPGGTLVDRR